jgi:hypothetical protein
MGRVRGGANGGEFVAIAAKAGVANSTVISILELSRID